MLGYEMLGPETSSCNPTVAFSVLTSTVTLGYEMLGPEISSDSPPLALSVLTSTVTLGYEMLGPEILISDSSLQQQSPTHKHLPESFVSG